MQQIKKSSLNNSLIIVISSLLTSYFFIQVYPIEQRAVDAGLVLAGFVNYPDQTSPMTEYFIKSWTSVHQIAKFFFNLDWSILNVSKLIIFITATFYFLGIVLTINSASRSIVIAILVAFMILAFQKNFGDTDYPSMIFFRTYLRHAKSGNCYLYFWIIIFRKFIFSRFFFSFINKYTSHNWNLDNWNYFYFFNF